MASGGAAAPPDSGWKDGAKADEVLGHGEAGGDDATLSSLPATPQKRIIFVFASFLYALSFTVSTAIRPAPSTHASTATPPPARLSLGQAVACSLKPGLVMNGLFAA